MTVKPRSTRSYTSTPVPIGARLSVTDKQSEETLHQGFDGEEAGNHRDGADTGVGRSLPNDRPDSPSARGRPEGPRGGPEEDGTPSPRFWRVLRSGRTRGANR